jgi:hypothetical protein
MRSDMSKVLVERPRYRWARKGRGSYYPRATLARPFGPEIDDAPTKCGIAWRHHDKWPNENLAPLRRFLLGSVGRPWSNVYGELSEHVSRDSAVQAHIFQHLEDYVARHVELRDGVPFDLDRRYRPGPLFERRGTLQLFVCPRTGLLRRAKREPAAVSRFGRCIRIDCRAELREVDGKWMHVTLAPVRPGAMHRSALRQLFDVLLGAPLDPEWFDPITPRFARLFGRTGEYAISMREPGRRELERIARSK